MQGLKEFCEFMTQGIKFPQAQDLLGSIAVLSLSWSGSATWLTSRKRGRQARPGQAVPCRVCETLLGFPLRSSWITAWINLQENERCFALFY